MIGLASAGVVLVALIVLATVLSRIFGDVGGSIDGDQLGLNPTTSASNAATGSVVKPVKATVFSPEGGADAPSRSGIGHRRRPGHHVAGGYLTDPTPSRTSRTVWD